MAEPGGACPFCGQGHPTGPDFLGIPTQPCPNLPAGWIWIDGVVVDTTQSGRTP
jgi:hypothetical protein